MTARRVSRRSWPSRSRAASGRPSWPRSNPGLSRPRGLRRYFGELADSWEEWRNEVEEMVEVGPDTVVATVRFQGVGRNSGAAVEARFGVVFVLAEGKLLRGHAYPSREEALEAVGLRENESLKRE